ncbi:hypothetical protein [Streptomyces vietnamensis]|uniref:Uncharacterized protein n=1 Tax=Streptomyces vietnamensis TaxID=362257 RepID=A0A0B5I4Q2_9ACTN|nr:hypothetical protein [Streptomyces vietnamensis]AJF69085.1 hypothetical protein SVTN_37105 [Streptomyces vietnamensis]
MTNDGHPSPTAADLWVTAARGRDAAADALRESPTADDLLGTLRALHQAQRAAELSVGAAVEALLSSGHPWHEIAAALGLGPTDEARRVTERGRAEAREATRRRLPH